MNNIITKDSILNAWEKYKVEFDREKTEKEISGGGVAFNEFESEILYSVVRLIKPTFIIEMSPDRGFTTKIIIDACKKNKNKCEIYSFDIRNSSKNLDIETEIVTRKLIIGDVHSTLTNDYLKKCDFMFIDSDHSYDFGKWYSKNKLPLLKEDIPIWIHDWPMYESNGAPCNFCPEFYQEKPERQGEPNAVKEFFIKKKLGKPILNCTDILKEQSQIYLNGKRGISASQILIRVNVNEGYSDNA